MFDVSIHHLTQAFHRFRSPQAQVSVLEEAKPLLSREDASAEKAKRYVASTMDAPIASSNLPLIKTYISPKIIQSAHQQLAAVIQEFPKLDSFSERLETSRSALNSNPSNIKGKLELLDIVSDAVKTLFENLGDDTDSIFGYNKKWSDYLTSAIAGFEKIHDILDFIEPAYNSPKLEWKLQDLCILLHHHKAWGEYMQADIKCLQSIAKAGELSDLFLMKNPNLENEDYSQYSEVLFKTIDLELTGASWVLDPYLHTSKPSLECIDLAIAGVENALLRNEYLIINPKLEFDSLCISKQTSYSSINVHEKLLCQEYEKLASTDVDKLKIVFTDIKNAQSVYDRHPWNNIKIDSSAGISKNKLLKFKLDSAQIALTTAYCLAALAVSIPRQTILKIPGDAPHSITVDNAYRIKNKAVNIFKEYVSNLAPGESVPKAYQLDFLAKQVFPEDPMDFKSKPHNILVQNLISFRPASLIFPNHRAIEYPPGVIS